MSKASDFFAAASVGGFKMTETIASNLTLKETNSLTADDLSADFWNSITDTSNPTKGFRGQWISTLADTLEQDIIDDTGVEGVLTSVICPVFDTATTVATVRVEADGVIHTFTSHQPIVGALANSFRFLVGAFMQWNPITVGTNATGMGSGHDYGFGLASTSLVSLGVMTPLQAIGEDFGIPFEDSIRVSIQMSEPRDTGTYQPRAGVLLTNFIKKG